MKKPTLHMCTDNVLVKHSKPKEKEDGGIIIASHIQNDNLRIAEVISTGPDVENFKTGMNVILSKDCGTDVSSYFEEIPDVEYLIVKSWEIIGTKND